MPTYSPLRRIPKQYGWLAGNEYGEICFVDETFLAAYPEGIKSAVKVTEGKRLLMVPNYPKTGPFNPHDLVCSQEIIDVHTVCVDDFDLVLHCGFGPKTKTWVIWESDARAY